VIKYKFIFF